MNIKKSLTNADGATFTHRMMPYEISTIEWFIPGLPVQLNRKNYIVDAFREHQIEFTC